MAAVNTLSVHSELPDLMSPSNTEKATLAALMSAINAGSFEISAAEYGMSPQRATVNAFCRTSSSPSSATAPTTPTRTDKAPTAATAAHLCRRSIMKILHCWLLEVHASSPSGRGVCCTHYAKRVREVTICVFYPICV